LVNGKLIAAASEERFTRVKNQGGFPERALRYVMRQAGVTAADVDHVAYAALPFGQERKRDISAYFSNLAYVASADAPAARKLSHLANYSKNLVFANEWLSWGKTERALRRWLGDHGLANKLVFVDHHRAHCASAYYTSGFDRCLAVSLDGYGSGQAGSFYLCEAGKIELLQAIPYPHSLGTFYRRVTQALGFKPNRHEGKIVGLAAFGDPSKLEAEVLARFDLSHEDYYRVKSSQDPFADKRLAARYEPKDVAAAYQAVLERVAVDYISRWVKRTGVDQVACAGGVFANVKMNQRVMEIPGLQEIFVFPAMGDSGVGVGAAYALAADLGGVAPEAIDSMYLGPSFDDREIERALQRSGLEYRRSADIEQEIVDCLIAGRVVARFDGAMEFGPRALGNRSILYPAIDPNVNKWLNDRLKRTEFMPFAPVSLESEAHKLYSNIDALRHTAQFMTVTTDCTPRMRAESPAAVHVDGTARPQLVNARTNASLHRLLTLYFRETGIPTLINTSYNMHEEPIVCSPDDAIRAFLDGRLEVLAIGPFIVEQTQLAA
jgi:carbamoyltransferase